MFFLSHHPLSTHIRARFVCECSALCNQLLKSMPALSRRQDICNVCAISVHFTYDGSLGVGVSGQVYCLHGIPLL